MAITSKMTMMAEMRCVLFLLFMLNMAAPVCPQDSPGAVAIWDYREMTDAMAICRQFLMKGYYI